MRPMIMLFRAATLKPTLLTGGGFGSLAPKPAGGGLPSHTALGVGYEQISEANAPHRSCVDPGLSTGQGLIPRLNQRFSVE